MEAIREWLQANLAIAPVIQDVLLFPLLAALLAWMIGRAVLAVLFLRVRDPERRARLRKFATYAATVLAVVLFSGVWLRGIRRLAALFGDRSPDEIERLRTYLNGGLSAVLATGVLVLLLRFLSRLVDLVSSRLDRWAGIGTPIRFRGLDLAGRDRVRDAALLVVRVARGMLVLLLVYIYVPLVLSFFPATAPYGDRLLQFVLRPAGEIVLALVGYLPNLIYLLLIVVAARYALKLLRFLLNAVGRGDLVFGRFDAEWADPTYKLLRVLVVVFTLMIGYPYLPGAQSEFFKAFSLFIGALVTLGSTAAVGNMAAGVILTYTRAFRIGDRVRIGDAVGDVLVKSLFVTRLRTIANEEITIPNGVVLSGQIVNYTYAANRRELVLTTEVGIGYDVHWSRIEELLKAAAARTPGILGEPEPFVWPAALGDFAVVYELHAYTDRADIMGGTYAALRRNTLDALHRAGIEIMTPGVNAIRDASRPAVPPENASGGTNPDRGILADVLDGIRSKRN